MNIHNFLHRWSCGVKNFQKVFSGFVLCLWSGQSEFMALFKTFNLWIYLWFVFESCT